MSTAIGSAPVEGRRVADAAQPGTTEGFEARELRFSEGIPGLPGGHRYVLQDLTDDGTFQTLTCVEDPAVSLVVTSPWLFFPDYAPQVPEVDQQTLALEQPEDAIVFCTVVAEETQELALNLRAPFIANQRTLTARQVLLEDDELPLRATVSAEG